MSEWVESTVGRILSLRPQIVLEIGCGTGMLLFRIAPHCSNYWGIDISAQALTYIQQQIRALDGDWSDVQLSQKSAHELAEFEAQSFDTIILNSVVQLFPDIDYLVKVIEQATRLLKPGGFIFLGDIRNLHLLKTYHSSVQLYKADDSLSCAALRQRIEQALSNEEELVIAPEFFTALTQNIPRINYAQIQLKSGIYQNELTRFRYDVTLGIDQVVSTPVTQNQPTSQVNSWSNYANQPFKGQRDRQLINQLQTFLQERLPDYMIPSTFLILDSIPLTPNGKIDRKALASLPIYKDSLVKDFVRARTPIENTIAKIWTDILGVAETGVEQNFFEIGGNSLLATQVISRTREAFLVDLPLRSLFEYPTVGKLADHINQIKQDILEEEREEIEL